MNKTSLGRTGLQVSRIGFGGAPAAYLAADRQRCSSMLNKLLDAGMNVLDTAASYPGSERFIGDHLSTRRKDYVIISKCGSKIPESSAAPWSAKLVTDTVDRALRLLKTDVVDVMLLHSCDLETLKQGEAMGGSFAKARGRREDPLRRLQRRRRQRSRRIRNHAPRRRRHRNPRSTSSIK